jgi:hypothetical protein
MRSGTNLMVSHLGLNACIHIDVYNSGLGALTLANSLSIYLIAWKRGVKK